VLVLVLALVIAARIQTFNDPVIGFDEQYYLLVADRMLDGALPYVDIWDRKPIGLFLLYALAFVGGDPFVVYKLLAAGCVAATALAIGVGARREGGPAGALLAALLYVVWLNFMEGEGGQAPVWYNLPVLIAALLVRRVHQGRAPAGPCGLLAMALVGLALQIKYTVVFEGLFFGLVLLRAGHRAWGRSPRLIGWGAAWVGVALAPTLAALGFYLAIGEGNAFVFANFLSIFGRLPDPLGTRLAGLAVLVLVLLPLAALAMLSGRRKGRFSFDQLWAMAAALGVLVFGSWLSPNYAIPVVPPLLLCAAPWLGRGRRSRAVGMGLIAVAFVGGQIAVAKTIEGKGTAAQARAVAEAARPRTGGCLWVWDGYPALYMMTGSCLPTRWAFPGHLNTLDEASARAIGVDPQAEVRRILAARPETIVDDWPAYALGNRETRALVQAELARTYALQVRIQTGSGRYRLVYRRKAEPAAAVRPSP